MSNELGATRAAAEPLHYWRRCARLILLALLAAGMAGAWYWRASLDPVAIGNVITRYPAVTPLVFLGLHVIASLLFVPRTLFATAAGLVFGIVWGTLWAALGSVLGAIAGFWIARYIDPGLVDLDQRARIPLILDRIQRGGWRAVALVRLIPVIPHSLVNYALGLTPMRLAPYAFGSLVGQLPMTIACVDLGAAGEELALGRTGWLTPTVIGAAALGLTLLIPALARRRAG